MKLKNLFKKKKVEIITPDIITPEPESNHQNENEMWSVFAYMYTRAAKSMIENEEIEEMLEGTTIQTAAVSENGIILRLSNGMKFSYFCNDGKYCVEKQTIRK